MQRPKFSTPKLMDFRSKIREVIGQNVCERHAARLEEPCFVVPRDSGGYYFSICNHRVKKLFDGKISDMSVRNKRPKKEHS